MERTKRSRGSFRDTPYGQRALKVLAADVRRHNAAVSAVNLRSVGVNSTSLFQAPTRKEKKFIDVSSSALLTAAQATGTLSGCLSAMAQGTDANNHVGRECTLKSLYWQFACSMAATSAGSSPIRLVIVYDKEANGAAPTIATGAASDIFATDAITAPMNLNNRDRFIILVDEIIECLGSAGPQGFYRKGYKKMSLPMIFNSTTTQTVSAIQTGSVYAVVWQNGNIITTAPTHNLYTRIRFTDA